MNWLHKHVKLAQNAKLSINGIRALKSEENVSDMPGQGYLFQGPEISELQRIRGLNQSQILNEMEKMLHYVFEVYSENMKDEVTDDPPDFGDDYYNENIEEYASIFLQDYNFNTIEDELSLATYIDEESLHDIIKTSLSNYHELPNAEQFKSLYADLKQWEDQYHKFNLHDISTTAQEVAQSYREARNKEAEGHDGTDIFNDKLAEFSIEILEAIKESIDNTAGYRLRQDPGFAYMSEELPNWIDESFFDQMLLENSEALQWYIDNNKYSLEEIVDQNLYEMHYENFRETSRQLEHQYGFNVLDWLSSDYDPQEEDDLRFDLSLEQLSDISSHLVNNGHEVYGAPEAAEQAISLLYAVHELAESNEHSKLIFASDLANATFRSDHIMHGVQTLANNAGIEIFGPLAERMEGIRRAGEEERARIRAQEEAKLQERQRLEEERNRKLPSGPSNITPEDLQKMRDMGVARRPFGHQYYLDRTGFPGSGFMNSPESSAVPFRITISPDKNYLGEDKIPNSLLREMNIHQVRDSSFALGWVGGYADYNNMILYISEVQSDVMQRTPYMRDPVKLEQQHKEEVASIENEIKKLETSLQNMVSPRQRIIQTLDRIRQENVSLDPSAPQFQKNQQTIDNLLRQLPNAPDNIDTTKTQQKIQGLYQSLAIAKQKGSKKQDKGNRFVTKYPKWHDYKSRLENVFKDWIPLFFNSALRVARDNQYQKVRIVTADELMKIWSAYARPETKGLYERIYDNLAQRYGATLIRHNGQQWWEIDMNRKDLNIASSWFKRIVRKANVEWLTQTPGGKYVWQIHLDKYFEIMKREAPELVGEQEFGAQEGDYASTEGKKSVFEMWLHEVPMELKIGDNLEPAFKEGVRKYLIETQNFDPYEYEDEEDINIPSADELNNWFS